MVSVIDMEGESERGTYVLGPGGLSPEGQGNGGPDGEHGQVALTTPHAGKS
jgi:hypothetical protein